MRGSSITRPQLAQPTTTTTTTTPRAINSYSRPFRSRLAINSAALLRSYSWRWSSSPAARDGGAEEAAAVRDGAVDERGARGDGAQREGPRLRPRPRRPPHRRPQATRLPRPQPFRPDPRAAGWRRSPVRVPRDKPVHRDQVQGGGRRPAAGGGVAGEAGGVAGGGVAPLLPGHLRAGVPAPHQAPPRRRDGPGRRRQARRRAGQGARRLRRPPRRQPVPRRRPLHARRREPHVLPAVPLQDAQGGARRVQAARQGVVGRHLGAPGVEEDRRRHPLPAGRLRHSPALTPPVPAWMGTNKIIFYYSLLYAINYVTYSRFINPHALRCGVTTVGFKL